MTIPVEPRTYHPASRATKNKSIIYGNEIREYWQGEEATKVVFIMPYPRGWSNQRKAKAYMTRTTSGPDILNLARAFMMAIMKENSFDHLPSFEKRYGPIAGLVIE